MQPPFEVLASGYGLVEGPTYAPDGSLYFSDVLGGGVYQLTPSGSVGTVVPKRRGVGGVALHADGGVVCSGRDIVHVRDGVTRRLFGIEGLPGWNDLCTDAAGRVYSGALRFAVFDVNAIPVAGECWRIERENEATELYDDVVHANGIALAPDERTIYHSDTRTNCVIVHELDEDGRAGTRRVIDTSAYGAPDGMAVDESGAVWVAVIGLGLARFTPAGELDDHIEVPARVVTSLCFGGADGRDLYVVTGDNTDDAALRGCVLRTRVDVAGAPVHPARV
jgi:gluconolactonase